MAFASRLDEVRGKFTGKVEFDILFDFIDNADETVFVSPINGKGFSWAAFVPKVCSRP